MDKKICLVTGGTSGLGRETARQLAAQGFNVLLTGRDRARGEAVVTDIRTAGGQAEFLPVDFASLASVRALADAVRQRTDRLHVLVNNAGLVSNSASARRLTADGFEETFQINHLSTFLLTALLRDLLVAGAPSRVVTVSSEAHRLPSALPFDNLQAERRYKPFLAYGVSKLANVLFTRELARQLESSGVTANCLHPGVVRTGIWASGTGFIGFIARLGQVFMLTAENAARSITRLATDPSLANLTGRYFNRDTEAAPTAGAVDAAAATRLWQESERMTGL